MEAQEIQNALESIKSQVAEKTKGLDGLESKTSQMVKDVEVKLTTANAEQIDTLKKEFNERLDGVVAELKAKKAETKTASKKSFDASFAEAIEERKEDIAKYSKGQSIRMELKETAILDVETNNTLTGVANGAGGAVINQNGSVILPSPVVNFANLVRTITGSGDTIRIWREASTQNAVAKVTKGNQKPEQDFSIPPVDFTATYRAGLYRFHKSMFRNLPWMQGRLPEMLRRNYFRRENADFYTDLNTAATAYSGSATGVVALVEAIAQLESADFAPNGIVLNPADWASISVTRDDENSFTLPSTVTFTGGNLVVNGVPVFKASFMPAGRFFVGDWTQAYKYVTDGLKVELFEQDVDNVQYNAITSRVEESNVLVIEQPLAFIKGDIAIAPSV